MEGIKMVEDEDLECSYSDNDDDEGEEKIQKDWEDEGLHDSKIDPFLPPGYTTRFSRTENQVRLKITSRPKIGRSDEEVDKQWHRLVQEGFDPKKIQFKEYIKNGILSWYDLTPQLREKHDREMKMWREGRILVTEKSSDDLESNQKYVVETYACENDSLKIAKKILEHLDMNKVQKNRRLRKWIMRRYKTRSWQIRRLRGCDLCG
jgi:hypothetical protein